MLKIPPITVISFGLFSWLQIETEYSGLINKKINKKGLNFLKQKK
jgi:hypothetical protein